MMFNIHLMKSWTAIDNLSIIWKSVHSGNIKRYLFQAVDVLIVLYGCTLWTLTKRSKKKGRWDLQKNPACSFESNASKTTVIWPLTSHLINHLSETNKTAGEGRTNS